MTRPYGCPGFSAAQVRLGPKTREQTWAHRDAPPACSPSSRSFRLAHVANTVAIHGEVPARAALAAARDRIQKLRWFAELVAGRVAKASQARLSRRAGSAACILAAPVVKGAAGPTGGGAGHWLACRDRQVHEGRRLQLP